MIACISFLAGLLIGGCVAVGILSAVQINRINGYEREIYQLKEKLKNN
jgi:hypothetical protein